MAKNGLKSTTFIGIDLAWGQRNLSGGAVIRNGRLRAITGELRTNRQIVDFIGENLTAADGAVVAIDAPLVVPNLRGSRPCDRALSSEWRRYQAGAYPANRRLLAHNGVVRGEALVATLVDQFRFRLSGNIPRRSKNRIVCEVYPHPAHISLFDLDRTLKYKRRTGRSTEERRLAFNEYQRLLRSLHKAVPPLKKTRKLLKADMSTLRGRGLQAYEEMLDALSCAYIGYYLWWHGPARSLTYGSVEEGQILVPLTPAMARRLQPSPS